jgi:outer membrane lipoprotein SlyB
MNAGRCAPYVRPFTLAAVMTFASAVADAQPTTPPPLPGIVNSNGANAKTNPPPSDVCDQCGKVLSIRKTLVKEQWTPLGGGAGFTNDARAATMFQIGPGLSNEGKVMVGAAGGATYQKTPNVYEKPRWEVTVRMDNGQPRIVSLAYEPYVQEGDRVRISGRNVELIE